MDLSTQFKKANKKYGMPDTHIVMADLISLGYSNLDAYRVVFQEMAVLPDSQLKKEADDFVSDAAFKKLLKDRGHKHAAEDLDVLSKEELMDKEQTAKLIMRAAMKQPADSKERVDGLIRYADLMGFKREEVAVEDNLDTIHFFFPVKCSMCPLLKKYNNYQKRHNKEGEVLRAIDMEHIIRSAASTMEKLNKK